MPGEFDLELAKLHALNKHNLEIWQRVQELAKTPYQVLQSISFSARYAAPYDYGARGQYTLRLNFTNTYLKQPALGDFFSGNLVPNFFNDTLPGDTYFDLANIIEKYSFLNPEKALSLLHKWKAALEKVQVELGAAESAVSAAQESNLLAISYFSGKQELVHELAFVRKDALGTLNLTFDWSLPEGLPLDNLKPFAALVHAQFKLVKSSQVT